MITNGHDLDDLKYRYTIEQVYLFFEKCKKINLDNTRVDALTIANAINYASPRFSDNNKDFNSRKKSWSDFMDSLDWGKLEQRGRKTIKDFSNMFKNAGIPIKGKDKTKKDTN